MALALEGVDLVVIALFLFLLAFLHATKWTIEPLVGALHGALGWVPFVGNLVDRADRAIIAALNDAIAGTEEVISTLWAGVVWSFNLMIDGLSTAWADTAAAFEHAFSTSIPNAFDSLWKETTHLVNRGVGTVADLGGDVAAALRSAELYAAQHATAALHTATAYTDTWIGKLGRQLGQDIAAVETVAHAAAATAAHAVDVAEHAAAGTSQTITNLITNELPAEISALAHELTAAEGAVAGELPRLPGLALDDIEQLLRSKEFGTLAGLLAAVPLVNALVHALAAESGLSTAECRSKVKGICGTDPLRWAHLLEGLAFAFVMPSLDELADAIAEITVEVADVITGFAGIAA